MFRNILGIDLLLFQSTRFPFFEKTLMLKSLLTKIRAILHLPS